MANFIEVTALNDDKFFVNMDLIEAIKIGENRTILTTPDGDGCYVVKESAREILHKINLNEAVK
ncbi:flagellar FlbD family protein [Pasteurella sp. P03HT]